MIDKCAVCGYSLEGLPAIHRCPECGRENDRDSVAVHGARPVSKAQFVVCALVAILFPLLSVFRNRQLSWMPSALFIPALVGLGVRYFSRPRVFVVSARFLELINNKSKVEIHSMADVFDARWSFVDGTTEILDERDDRLFTIPSRFLGSNPANKSVVAAIKHYVAQRDAAAAPAV